MFGFHQSTVRRIEVSGWTARIEFYILFRQPAVGDRVDAGKQGRWLITKVLSDPGRLWGTVVQADRD